MEPHPTRTGETCWVGSKMVSGGLVGHAVTHGVAVPFPDRGSPFGGRLDGPGLGVFAHDGGATTRGRVQVSDQIMRPGMEGIDQDGDLANGCPQPEQVHVHVGHDAGATRELDRFQSKDGIVEVSLVSPSLDCAHELPLELTPESEPTLIATSVENDDLGPAPS